MKQNVLPKLSLALFLFAFHFSFAQEQNFRELIIQVPGIYTSRGLPEIKNAISSVEGVRVAAFCQSQFLILMRVDNKLQPDNKPVFTAVKNLGYQYHVKPDVTIEKAMASCRDREKTIYQDVTPGSE